LTAGAAVPEAPLLGLLVALGLLLELLPPPAPLPLWVGPEPVPPVLVGFAAVLPVVDPDLTVVLLPAAVPALGLEDWLPLALPPPVAFAF
jgi:hypothetical protein